MRALQEHNVFEIQELGQTGAAAYMRVGHHGVSLSVHGHDVRSQDHVIFSISPEDASEIAGLSHLLTEAAEIAHRVGERKQEERRAEYVAEYGEEVAAALTANRMPVVRSITEGMFAHRWELRGGVVEDEDVVLGGLSWFRDRLDLRVNDVDTIVFDGGSFQKFSEIAANQPDFPEQRSIWDTPNQGD